MTEGKTSPGVTFGFDFHAVRAAVPNPFRGRDDIFEGTVGVVANQGHQTTHVALGSSSSSSTSSSTCNIRRSLGGHDKGVNKGNGRGQEQAEIPTSLHHRRRCQCRQ
eukprot:scaffold28921_cov191-Amphora_coffeaeformis.AAC.13